MWCDLSRKSCEGVECKVNCFTMEYGLLIFIALAFLALHSEAALTRQNGTVDFVAGLKYIYNYEATSLTGIPSLNNQKSGLKIKSELHFIPIGKGQTFMQMKNVWLGKLNDNFSYQNKDNKFVQIPEFNYEENLKKPVRFAYRKGKIAFFVAESSDPEWSLNIKKGVLSLLNVEIRELDELRTRSSEAFEMAAESQGMKFKLYEAGIGGNCKTKYSIKTDSDAQDYSIKHSGLNITKTRNMNDCISKPVHMHHNYHYAGCQNGCSTSEFVETTGDKNPDSKRRCITNLVESFSTVKYNISTKENPFTIEGISNQAYMSYRVQGKEIVADALQTVRLQNIDTEKPKIPDIVSPLLYRTLEFEMTDKFPNGLSIQPDEARFPEFREQFVRNAKDALLELSKHILASDVADEAVAQQTTELLKGLSELAKHELSKLLEQVTPRKEESDADLTLSIARKLLLDAIPLCSSNEAAQFAKTIVEAKVVDKWEAIEMISSIPQNIFYPTGETIEDYLDLCHNHHISSDKDLLNTACLAFAKLVRKRCSVSNSENQQPQSRSKLGTPSKYRYFEMRQSRQFQESLKRFRYAPRLYPRPNYVAKVNTQCIERDIRRYIKVMWTMFQEEKAFDKKMVLLRALFSMGVEQAIPLLEPLVTSDQKNCAGFDLPCNDEERHFLRATFIYFLHGFARVHPKIVLPMVSSIYFNKVEPSHVRAAALTVILATDPPLTLLQRIVTELWEERSLQIQSFVLSALESYANNPEYCFQNKASKIKSVLNHAPKKDFGSQYSKHAILQYINEDQDQVITLISSMVHNRHSPFPQAGFVSFNYRDGPLSKVIGSLDFTTKGLDHLNDYVPEVVSLYKYFQPSGTLHRHDNDTSYYSNIEKSTEKIPIAPRLPEEPRLVLSWNLFDQSGFYALNKDALQQLFKDKWNDFSNIGIRSPNGSLVHYFKLFVPTKFAAILPSDVGLPVEITHVSPLIVRARVENPHVALAKPIKEIPFALNITANIQLWIHYSSQYSMSIVSKADQMNYGTSHLQMHQFHLPGNISVTINNNGSMVSINPKLPFKFHHHVVISNTFIGKRGIDAAETYKRNSQKKAIKTLPQPYEYREEIGHSWFGMGATVTASSENPWLNFEPLARNSDVLLKTTENMLFPSLKEHAWDAIIETNPQTPVTGYEIWYRNHHDYQGRKAESRKRLLESDDTFLVTFKQREEEEDTEYSEPFDTLTDYEDKDYVEAPLARALNKAMPLHAVDVHTVKVVFKSPLGDTKWNGNFVVDQFLDKHKLAFALTSTVHGPSARPLLPLQVCLQGNISYSSLKGNLRQTPLPTHAEFDMTVKWNEGCNAATKENIKIRGILEKHNQSDASLCDLPVGLTDSNQNTPPPWYYCQCLKDSHERKHQSYACQLTLDKERLAINKVEVHINATMVNSSRFLQYARDADLMIKKQFFTRMTEYAANRGSFDGTESSAVDLSITDKDDYAGHTLSDIKIGTPYYRATYEDVQLPMPRSLFSSGFAPENYWSSVFGNWLQSVCTATENTVRTFDNFTYDTALNGCEHLLVKECTNKPSFAILLSTPQDNQSYRKLTVILPEHQIELKPNSGQEFEEITVDENKIRINPESPVVFCNDYKECIVINVLKMSESGAPDVVDIDARHLGLHVQFDGQNTRIQTSRAYFNRLCGLCGNFDGETSNELEGPQRCIYSEVRDFVKSYASDPEKCGITSEIDGEMICSHYSNTKPGEFSEPCMVSKTIYVERGEHICFSTEPVNSCPSCKQTATRIRKMGFHCVHAGTAFADNMKQLSEHQIIQEFADQRVDFADEITEPIACNISNQTIAMD